MNFNKKLALGLFGRPKGHFYSFERGMLATILPLRDLPLIWLTSYLSERSASVTFHSSRSSWRHTPFGLPQGSVLGPLLYILFTADIGPLLASWSLASHSYADDVQS